MKGTTTSNRSRKLQPGDKAKRSQAVVETVLVEEDVDRTVSEEEEAAAAAAAASTKPFRLLDLPFELRLRVYEEVLLVHHTIDLNPLNVYTVLPRLPLLLTCRQVHEEAFRIFYSQAFYLFPTHGRFFHTKKPLLARLPLRYREVISAVAWRIGPGWGSPPKNQNTNPILGLSECTNLRTLKIFVECDPSDSVFAGFRGAGANEDTYKYFCINILLGIFEQVPSISTVEVDAYPSVKKESPIVLGLRRHIERAGKTLAWGPLRGWDKDSDEPGLVGLESALASMKISGTPRLVQVPA